MYTASNIQNLQKIWIIGVPFFSFSKLWHVYSKCAVAPADMLHFIKCEWCCTISGLPLHHNRNPLSIFRQIIISRLIDVPTLQNCILLWLFLKILPWISVPDFEREACPRCPLAPLTDWRRSWISNASPWQNMTLPLPLEDRDPIISCHIWWHWHVKSEVGGHKMVLFERLKRFHFLHSERENCPNWKLGKA